MQLLVDDAKPSGSGVSRFCSFAWPLLFLCVVSAPIQAHGADITGTYELTVDDTERGCRWVGPMVLAQTGMTFTGTVDLPREFGASPCPTDVSAMVSGSVSGSTVTYSLTPGGFATATFTGTIGADVKSATGTWMSLSPAASGTWSARNADVTITAQLTMTRAADGCQWTGPATVTGSTVVPPFAGSVALTRVAGGSTCPSTVSGPISGTVLGSAVSFGLMSGELGNASFVGAVSGGRSASGTWSGDAGSGTWIFRGFFGVVQPAPALSILVLATLFALLTAAGVLSARRKTL